MRHLRRAGVVVAWLLCGGCAMGYGSSYPGAQERNRTFGVYEDAGPGWIRLVGFGSESTSDELPWGIVGGMRFGAVAMALDDQVGTSFGASFHAKALFTPLSILGVGLETGYETFYGARPADESSPQLDLMLRRVPIVGIVELVPLKPFSLRAGVGWSAFGAGTLGKTAFDVDGSVIYQLGVSLNVPFPGAHFVHSIDWRRTHAGHLPTGEAWRLDAFLYEFQILF